MSSHSKVNSCFRSVFLIDWFKSIIEGAGRIINWISALFIVIYWLKLIFFVESAMTAFCLSTLLLVQYWQTFSVFLLIICCEFSQNLNALNWDILKYELFKWFLMNVWSTYWRMTVWAWKNERNSTTWLNNKTFSNLFLGQYLASQMGEFCCVQTWELRMV